MSDNSVPIPGGDIYSTDQITTLNGTSIATGEKAQRVKVGFGADSFFTDVTTAAPLPAVVQAAQTTTTGSITSASSIVTASVSGMAVATVTMTGTFAGVTVVFDGTTDGTNWFSMYGLTSLNSVPTSGFYGVSSAVYQVDFPLVGYTQIRARATAWTSGTANITIVAKGSGSVAIGATSAVGSVGNGSAIYSPPVFVGGTDGTNARSLYVKPGSTAAVAADQALVVGLHPSSNTVSHQSSLTVSGISAANTAFTTTLPAPAAGLFHYITGIEIIRVNATVTAVAAAASLISITTTNLPGSLAWSFGNAIGAGAADVLVRDIFSSPIKASAAATATTIVCPAGGTGVQFRVNVYYYTA